MNRSVLSRRVLAVAGVSLLLLTAGCSTADGYKSVPEDYVDPANWEATANITAHGPIESVSVEKQRLENSSDFLMVYVTPRNETATVEIDQAEVIAPNRYSSKSTVSVNNRTHVANVPYHEGEFIVRLWANGEIVSEIKITPYCVDECDPEPLPEP